jgi:hypothetical protein
MQFLRDMSIGQKLTAIIVLTSAVTLLMACVAIGVYDILSFRRSMTVDLATLAEVVARNSTAALTFHDAKAAEDVLAALKPSLTSLLLAFMTLTANPSRNIFAIRPTQEQFPPPLKQPEPTFRTVNFPSFVPSDSKEILLGLSTSSPILEKCLCDCNAMLASLFAFC